MSISTMNLPPRLKRLPNSVKKQLLFEAKLEIAGLNPPIPEDVLPWREWLAKHFPHVASKPFAARHESLWEWFENLGGAGIRPRVEAWPRAGAKSTTGEL